MFVQLPTASDVSNINEKVIQHYIRKTDEMKYVAVIIFVISLHISCLLQPFSLSPPIHTYTIWRVCVCVYASLLSVVEVHFESLCVLSFNYSTYLKHIYLIFDCRSTSNEVSTCTYGKTLPFIQIRNFSRLIAVIVLNICFFFPFFCLCHRCFLLASYWLSAYNFYCLCISVCVCCSFWFLLFIWCLAVSSPRPPFSLSLSLLPFILLLFPSASSTKCFIMYMIVRKHFRPPKQQHPHFMLCTFDTIQQFQRAHFLVWPNISWIDILLLWSFFPPFLFHSRCWYMPIVM